MCHAANRSLTLHLPTSPVGTAAPEQTDAGEEDDEATLGGEIAVERCEIFGMCKIFGMCIPRCSSSFPRRARS